MKRIRIRAEIVMEVPDEWHLIEPNEDVGVHLEAGNRLLLPEFYWIEYAGGSPENGYTWGAIDEALDDRLFEMKKDFTVEMAEERI